MNDYTPTTEEIQAAYVWWRARNSNMPYHAVVRPDGTVDGPMVEFRRWYEKELLGEEAEA